MVMPMPVPLAIEPPSKNAICKVDYVLSSHPAICVVPIEVKRGQESSARLEHVHSQRLRRKAIRDLVASSLIPYRHLYAVHFWAEKAKDGQKALPIDHLLLLPATDDAAESCIRNFTNIRESLHPSKTVKHIKGTDGVLVTESVLCIPHPPQIVKPGQPFLPNANDCDYWKKFEILLREFVHTIAIKHTRST
jgi:hypothetical protein